MKYRLYIDGTTQNEFIRAFKRLEDALEYCMMNMVSHKGVYVFTDNGCVFRGLDYR
jgi:hypothetical protein